MRKKKSIIGWTLKQNLIEPNISNLNFYPNQPRYENGVLDSDFIEVKITIEEIK